MKRIEYADIIHSRLLEKQEKLQKEFLGNKINTFFLDDLLPENLAIEIYNAFPSKEDMAWRKSLRENKRVAAQLDKYEPLLEEITFAFHDERIVSLISKITGLKQLEPDTNLYAGGISLMSKGNFLRPHLDNSHDMSRNKYRVLNLLYYVTPNWKKEYGGNLELWDDGPKKNPRVIYSKFNRLAVMITNRNSYHSVSKVLVEGSRCCVSNYYFSEISADSGDYFHVTSFRGRNDEPIEDVILTFDAKFRNFLRNFKKSGLFKVWQKYEKK